MSEHLTVGIDPGVKTGLAIFNPKARELNLKTVKLFEGFEQVKGLRDLFVIDVVIENPNLWTHFRDHAEARAKLQGAGSVKRDYSAWVEFFEAYGIPYKSVRPDKQRNAIATNEQLFKKITGYTGRSSEHARVAGMLVWR